MKTAMKTKLYIHDRGWGIALALSLLFLSFLMMTGIGVLQTAEILTKAQGELSLFACFAVFLSSMYCLIA